MAKSLIVMIASSCIILWVACVGEKRYVGLQYGVFHELGACFWGPHSKDCGIMGLLLGLFMGSTICSKSRKSFSRGLPRSAITHEVRQARVADLRRLRWSSLWEPSGG